MGYPAWCVDNARPRTYLRAPHGRHEQHAARGEAQHLAPRPLRRRLRTNKERFISELGPDQANAPSTLSFTLTTSEAKPMLLARVSNPERLEEVFSPKRSASTW